LLAAFVSFFAAGIGTLHSVTRAASLPPAVAMQPPAPPKYRRSTLELLPFIKRAAQPTRMILRNLERRPLKAAMSVTGIAFACAILILGGFFNDAVDFMVAVQVHFAQRDDISVTFNEPTSAKAVSSLRAIPGVEYVEPFRAAPARLRYEHRSYRTSIQGYATPSELRRVLNTELKPVELPDEGLLLTDHLAQMLGAKPGDMLTVEMLEGERRVLRMPLAGVVKEFVGVGAYIQLHGLNRLLREGPTISGALLQTDAAENREIYEELRSIPRVAGASVRVNVLRNFYEIMARNMLTFAFFATILAGTIAFGVVYNSARIAFAERSRELASLRVLGFTRAEVSYILLGELAILTLLAIPFGFVIGRALGGFMVSGIQTDLFRIPLVINAETFAFATIVILASTVVSALAIVRKINRLDLVEVLKTRE
jgi:putative ABC transport system permease protein